MSSTEPNWPAVETEISRIIADSKEPFDDDTISNARDLVAFLQGRCSVPRVSKGYWSSISLQWKETSSGPLEIEVFEDRLEVYRFEPTFGVWYEDHKSGQPFSPSFEAELPRLE